ncbi:hypothetical protein CYMTET_15970, partial [Cymbomonas tetramitiformis]
MRAYGADAFARVPLISSHLRSEQVARILHDPESRAVVACAFSPDGGRLVTVTCDNSHTVTLWNWRTPDIGKLLPTGKTVGLAGSGNGYAERPIAVYGVVWNTFSSSADGEFATYGVKHLKLWNKVGPRWQARTCKFGTFKMDNIVSCAFLPPKPGDEGGPIVTGTPKGDIYVWRNGACARQVAAHKPGKQIITPDGNVTFSGVRCLRVRADGKTLLSGGADGIIHSWDVSQGKLGEQIRTGISLELPHMTKGIPALKALDSMPGSNTFIVGTDLCDIWEVDESPDVLIYGHTADLYSVCFHPTKPPIFMSASESSRVFLWNADNRALVRSCSVGFQCRVANFSETPFYAAFNGEMSHHIAVGGKMGRIIVIDELTLKPIFRDKWIKTVTGQEFAEPASGFVYFRAHRCSGHSSTVTHLDWSSDSSVIVANDQACELLHWSPHTGEQVTRTQRNQTWQTFTCTLGFPVMGVWK